ncbi:hypothetical protein CCHL11_04729 [Colletotrichum chlorophyti]|uniref:DUF1254 domain-containing protein n=1 Tax=Colletotrichum chlorophyti TaxID=708187 RepID=A0A1Q8S1L8_9PEZI|nr:hypothetical protein CCHL11_04729 [Colletotrichum chlorophyti]
MKLLQVVAGAVTAGCLSAGLVTAQNVTYLPWTACANQTTTCAQANLTFAYLYGYPLYQYALAVQRTPNATVNSLFHQRKVSTAADRWLNKPNVDTLYSRAFLDLSSSDLVINIPEIGDRYWVWPFYDAYGNNVANIGSLQSFPAGKYRVRFDEENPGVQRLDKKSRYQADINIPTPHAISVVRILVQPNDSDAAAVHRIQDRLSITPVRRASRLPSAPPLNLTMFTDPEIVPGPINTLEQGVLKLTAKLSPYNLPMVTADRAWVSTTLLNAGIDKGSFLQPKGTNLTAASQAANSSVIQEFFVPGYLQNLGNNWVHPLAEYIGNYHSAYFTRYNIAATGYLGLTRDQAMYPAFMSSTTSTIIPSTKALRLTFSAKPKLKKNGFWSLTIYDANAYLIPNDLNRYMLGDRSSIAFMNGTTRGKDGEGPFQILIQPSNVPPPANWTSNWLPAPADGTGFQMNLRFYGVEDELVNGSYVYPVVETIDAITEATTACR